MYSSVHWTSKFLYGTGKKHCHVYLVGLYLELPAEVYEELHPELPVVHVVQTHVLLHLQYDAIWNPIYEVLGALKKA